MSVRVNQRQKKEKAGLLSCFLSLVSHAITISNYGNFSKAEYLRTLRLKSKLFDLRVANANPYPENHRFSGWVDPDGVATKRDRHPLGVPVSFCW